MTTNGAYWALGAMSGTSLDGVDAATVLTDGVRVFEFGDVAYRPYTAPERAVLQAAMGEEAGPNVAAASEVVLAAHTEVLSGFESVDLVGFHGQTTFHAPQSGAPVRSATGRNWRCGWDGLWFGIFARPTYHWAGRVRP